jgi:hypothetical protein
MAREELNERQEKYCQNRAKGIGKQRSAVLAGYADVDKAGEQVEESVAVCMRIAELQRENAGHGKITKEKVLQGFVDAAEIARIQGDSTGMTSAWREAGKMLGYYAPEVKKIEKGISKSDLLKAMEDMTDAELLQLSHGRVIEGEFQRLPDSRAENLPALPSKPA